MDDTISIPARPGRFEDTMTGVLSVKSGKLSKAKSSSGRSTMSAEFLAIKLAFAATRDRRLSAACRISTMTIDKLNKTMIGKATSRLVTMS